MLGFDGHGIDSGVNDELIFECIVLAVREAKTLCVRVVNAIILQSI